MINNFRHHIFLLIFMGALLCLGTGAAFGQLTTHTAPDDPSPSSREESATIVALESIIDSHKILAQQHREKEAQLNQAATEDQKLRIAHEINEIDKKIDALTNNFNKIATGTDWEGFSAKPQTTFNWAEELQELLGPIIQELRGITARPREVEKLRNEVEYYRKRIPVAKTATENIEKQLANVKEPALTAKLQGLEKEWNDRVRQLSSQLAVAEYQLADRLNEKQPFWQSAQDVVRVFFKSRGRNLFLAVSAFLLVFFACRLFFRYVHNSGLIHKSVKHSFYLRLGIVTYHVLTFAGAITAFLLVLYIVADWVLLCLALIFLFGLAWTAKQAIPKFWNQGKILLNLSTVREGEKVIYRGLPWKVELLSFDTMLVNPDLKGAIRLPLRDLVNLHSRPYELDEPWFPCKAGDWVVLSDDTRGKVISQTPEMVQLVLLGGSRKTYLTEEFLKMNPNNISTNFRLNITFGIDYRHQAICTREVPQALKEFMMGELKKKGYEQELLNLTVEFKEAGTSSLDFALIADFSGRVAEDHDTLGRYLQQLAVDACNLYGWEIPFTQITVHAADSSREGKGEQDIS